MFPYLHYSSIKRLCDVLLAAFLILLLLPIFLITILSLPFQSPGPIFYQASRAGLHGTEFIMFKFRSMTVRKEHGSLITGPNDSRVFPFGSFLRLSKIDELPQLWNILIGDMSFVGPRPEDPFIVSKYYDADMLKTLTVRPGLTGPGSIFGYLCSDFLLDDCSPEESYVSCLLVPKLSYERYYVDHLNIIDDFRFLCITPVVILLTALRFPLRLPRWIKSYPEMSS